MEYKRPEDGKIFVPFGYSGRHAIKNGFPKVIKPNDLYSLTIIVPFNVEEYFKEQQLTKIKIVPIGLQLWIINYKGQNHEFIIYPIAQLNIEHDNEMRGIFYRSPTSFDIDIENIRIFPIKLKSMRVSNVILHPLGGTVTIPNPSGNEDEIDIMIK